MGGRERRTRDPERTSVGPGTGRGEGSENGNVLRFRGVNNKTKVAHPDASPLSSFGLFFSGAGPLGRQVG